MNRIRLRFALTLVCIIAVAACNTNDKKSADHKKKNVLEFRGSYVVCDTCEMTILVEHNECTDCKDIVVDSGAIYISNAILKKAEKLVVEVDTTNLFSVVANRVSVSDLRFEDKNYFKKLYTDTINYSDLYRVFRLKGKIVDIGRRKSKYGIIETSPSLFFRVSHAEEIDTAYLKKIKDEMK
ncbi:MAG: hypothetical protein EOO43_26545 [Flavobacterium sp.]|nr:MAG: hypothetical protein EOO43_26545 [Flavobacterium sp.]